MKAMVPFDAAGAFRPAASGSELRRLAVRGAGATVSASGLSLVAQVVSTVILARLLTPADFGVVAMVTTFGLLLMSFGVNGFTEAVIQCEEIDRFTASNLFWINLGVGLVLSTSFAVCGTLLSRLYRNPLVANVTVGVSLAVLVSSASVIHLALLKRAMRFGAASANDVVARVVYGVIAIVLALRGWSYWALVAGIVAAALSTASGAWWLCRWIPNRPRRTGRTGALIRFSVHVLGRFGIRYSSQNTDKLLIGWQFNAGALGFYKKAFDLFALSASQLTAPLHDVALAALSRVNRDPARFQQYLINTIGIIALVGMAVGADLTLVGKDVVRLVLGPQWGEAGTIFELFGPGIGIMLLYSVIGWIHLSIGRPDRWLRWTVLESCFMVLLFVLGLHWGPEGIALAWTTSFWLLLVPAFWYAGRPIRLPVSGMLSAVWKYVVAALAAGGATFALLLHGPLLVTAWTAMQALARMVAISALFGALYIGAVVLLHRGWAPLRQLTGLLREMVPWAVAPQVALAAAGDGERGMALALPIHEPGLLRQRSSPLRTTAAELMVKTDHKVRGLATRFLSCKPLQINASLPMISFTFDDFPRSALLGGGAILSRYGVRGTYYASLGLMGKQAPPGEIFVAEDLPALLEQGHELGCHTFGHCHSWRTQPIEFERSIVENRRALGEILPGAAFKTFAYPISEPLLGNKRRAAKHFLCCRGGGQTFNTGVADLNNLSAYFLEQSRGNCEAVEKVIDENRRAGGWLILATHDVCDSPSRYGCTPEFFEEVVKYAVDSGARILPVAQACQLLRDGAAAGAKEQAQECAGTAGSRRQRVGRLWDGVSGEWR